MLYIYIYVCYARTSSAALLVVNGNLLQSSNIFCLRTVSRKIVKNHNKFCLPMLEYFLETQHSKNIQVVNKPTPNYI